MVPLICLLPVIHVRSKRHLLPRNTLTSIQSRIAVPCLHMDALTTSFQLLFQVLIQILIMSNERMCHRGAKLVMDVASASGFAILAPPGFVGNLVYPATIVVQSDGTNQRDIDGKASLMRALVLVVAATRTSITASRDPQKVAKGLLEMTELLPAAVYQAVCPWLLPKAVPVFTEMR